MNNPTTYKSSDLALLKEVIARKDFAHFAAYMVPTIQMSAFHQAYYNVLNLFAHGAIRRLIVSVPPQHGKSLAASQLLPAYMLGLNPDAQMCIASYSATLAYRFNKRVQRVIREAAYNRVFPLTTLKDSSKSKSATDYAQTSDMFEIVGHAGRLMAVGREGSLTGNAIDIAILDDLYKDAMEANSPVVRDNTWEWYNSVVRTRQHNNSQELIVFTRWDEDDLIGRLIRVGKVKNLSSLDQLDSFFDGWYYLNFEAIKESDATELDPRPMGSPLWPDRHGLPLLNEKRALDRHGFDCLYQGHPSSKEGLLYGDTFKIYDTLSETIKKANYTDTADLGDDNLCSICYEVGKDGNIYITDILYTQEPMEITEPAAAQMLVRNNTRIAHIESNNGGRGFARQIQRLAPLARVDWFHQSGNKESRILTNAATVQKCILFPSDWKLRWPQLHGDLISYKRSFRANRWHDAPDVLTGIVEKEILKTRLTGAKAKVMYTP